MNKTIKKITDNFFIGTINPLYSTIKLPLNSIYINTITGDMYRYEDKTFNKLMTLNNKNFTIDLLEKPVAPKKLLIYYGDPIAYKDLYNTKLIADEISQYNLWVCGDGYQDPTHEAYKTTVQIIKQVRTNGTKVYGYIPIGVNTYNRSLDELYTAIDNWIKIGVDGIFIDEFGFDYEVSRERQVSVVNYIHKNKLPYIANAWVWEDVNIDNVNDLPSDWESDDWRIENYKKYNPNNIPLPKTTQDGYLIEDFCISEEGPTSIWDLHERVSHIINTNKYNMTILAEAVLPEKNNTIDFSKLKDLTNIDKISLYVGATAILYNLDYYGINGFYFGSNGINTYDFNLITLPDNIYKKNFTSTVYSNYNIGEFQRVFNNLILKVITQEDTHTVIVTGLNDLNTTNILNTITDNFLHNDGDTITGDLIYINNDNGPILIDRKNNKQYRLYIEDNTLGIEEV